MTRRASVLGALLKDLEGGAMLRATMPGDKQIVRLAVAELRALEAAAEWLRVKHDGDNPVHAGLPCRSCRILARLDRLSGRGGARRSTGKGRGT